MLRWLVGKSFSLSSGHGTYESNIQKRVAAMLRAYLPDEVWWTASLSGIPLAAPAAARAKEHGMQRGAPDLSFIFPDGRTRYIELKAAKGTLTPEQRALHDILQPVGCFAICRSWEEVRGILKMWLAFYGLRLLTDTESYQREMKRRAA